MGCGRVGLEYEKERVGRGWGGGAVIWRRYTHFLRTRPALDRMPRWWSDPRTRLNQPGAPLVVEAGQIEQGRPQGQAKHLLDLQNWVPKKVFRSWWNQQAHHQFVLVGYSQSLSPSVKSSRYHATIDSWKLFMLFILFYLHVISISRGYVPPKPPYPPPFFLLLLLFLSLF